MGYLILAATAVVSIGATAVTVLMRRQRRQVDSSSQAQRIEAAATSGIRDARRQTHAYRHFSDGGGLSALRDRDARSWR